MGKESLGFNSKEIGTHSIRSGGAMIYCLAKTESYIIQIIGRWKSDSFLKYIRKQIQEFTSGITDEVLKMEHFNHVPKDSNLKSP